MKNNSICNNIRTTLVLMLAIILCLGLFAGCKKDSPTQGGKTNTSELAIGEFYFLDGNPLDGSLEFSADGTVTVDSFDEGGSSYAYNLKGKKITVKSDDTTLTIDIVDPNTLVTEDGDTLIRATTRRTQAARTAKAAIEGQIFVVDTDDPNYQNMTFYQDGTVDIYDIDEEFSGVYTIDGPYIIVAIEGEQTALILEDESTLLNEDGKTLYLYDGEIGVSTIPDDIVLYAEYADLSDSIEVIVEPDEPPYNLGGWINHPDNGVQFHFDVEQTGLYKIGFEYSKDYQDAETVEVDLYSDTGEGFNDFLPSTGEGWGNYSYYESSGYLEFTKGISTLSIYPGMENPGDYLMNLRSVTIQYYAPSEE